MRYILPAIAVLVLATSPAPAVDKKAINEAIDRGVAGLKRMQRDDGTWPHKEIGATALAGLTLLECGVPKSDRSVQQAAEAVRKAGLTLTHTYSLSLSVLFLDRLDRAEDTPLIESMIVRLLAGQGFLGGWSYECPFNGPNEVKRLTAEMEGGRVLRGSRDLSRLPAKGKRTTADLPKEIQAQLHLLARAAAVPNPRAMACDNSNTQFATLALWVGRRYGVPTQAALLRVDRYFRSNQADDGGWGYGPRLGPQMPRGPFQPPPPPGAVSMDPTPTMTCAGLLGLVCGHGASLDNKKARNVKVDVSKDARLKAGLKALSAAVGKPVGWDGNGDKPAAIPEASGKAYYFFWSLERIAVILGLETIDRKDWYNWGAEILLGNQRPGGLWIGEYGDCGADTCFALLFLKKVDLAHDLTAGLKGTRGLGDKILKVGGVGGSGLKGVKPGKGFETVGIGAKPGKKKPDGEPDRTPDSKPKPATDTSKPRTAAEETANRLVQELRAARGETARAAVLKKLRDTRGSAYTDALAGVIPELDNEARKAAREALADRLTRMKATTLREYLKASDAEVRRAAALAIGQKDEKSLTPDLIGLLDDDSLLVRRAALASLKEMTRQDFGPRSGADAAERKKAIAAWRAWWKKQARE